MKVLRILLLVLVMMSSVSFCNAYENEPDGFMKVKFSMTKAEVNNVYPKSHEDSNNTGILQFIDEDEIIFEDIAMDFFMIQYAKGSDRIMSITLVKNYKNLEEFNADVPKFMKAMTNRYGNANHVEKDKTYWWPKTTNISTTLAVDKDKKLSTIAILFLNLNEAKKQK